MFSFPLIVSVFIAYSTQYKIDIFDEYISIIVFYGKFNSAKVVYVDKAFALQHVNIIKICLNIR